MQKKTAVATVTKSSIPLIPIWYLLPLGGAKCWFIYASNDEPTKNSAKKIAAKPTSPRKPSKQILSDKEKKGDMNLLTEENQYSILENILDISQVDYDDLVL